MKESKRKKSTKSMYFGPEVENAILRFNQEEIPHKKELIFNKEIYPALNKLAENIINVGKFYRYETSFNDLKSDIITFLYERIPLVSPERGKAYSFFTLSATRYCIKKSQDLYKEQVRQGDMKHVDEQRNLMSEMASLSYKESLKDFIQEWTEWCYERLNILFKTKNERKVADAILTLFQNSGDLELYNKKELYILIREHSKIDTQYITKVSQQLKKIFFIMFEQYQKTGKISDSLYL